MVLTGMLYRATSPFGAQKFPEATSFSTCFSSDNSVTRCRRRPFSFSSSFEPVCLFQLQPAVFFAPAVVSLLIDPGLFAGLADALMVG